MFESVECLVFFGIVVVFGILFVAPKLEQERIKTDTIMWNLRFGKWQ
jgi:hypothetical protein